MYKAGSLAKRNFAADNIRTVCILANSRQADLIGSKIIRSLQQESEGKAELQFIGYGGPWMKKQGFDPTVEVDIDQFADKTFTTYRKTKTNEANFFRWNPLNLINKHYTRQTDDIYDVLNESQLPKRIYQSRPSLILNIDNEYMTFMLMDELKKFYKNSSVNMPQRHYLNRFVRDFRNWTERYVDFMHYTVPLTTAVGGNYKFPSEYMGQYGSYEAIRHIYRSSEKLRSLVSADGSELHINKKFFASDLEKAVMDVRASWRDSHGIPDDAHVIFVAAGNEVNEAEFSAENVRRGIKEFLLKYSAPTSMSPKARPVENFVTVISTHTGSDGEKYIKEHVKNNNWMGRVIFVNEQDNEHINAMCGADAGVIYDGQMVSSAAACHLPTMNMVNMRMHHMWYNELFNRWWNDMNIIADNNIYPELIGGEAWFGKITDTLAEWYVRPDIRYEMVTKFDGFLQESMSYKSVDRTTVKTRDITLSDGQTYDIYMDPWKVASRKMLEDIQAYELRGNGLHNHQPLKTRAVHL